jgi:hypothetical protein
MTPSQAVHQPTDMIAVIADSELPGDHLGNAGHGPQIGWVAMCDRSFGTFRAFLPPRRRASRQRITELASTRSNESSNLVKRQALI